ncbi:disease resistance protein RPP13 isoform X2 [Setaria italica]|uniref:disease resistance protein RPP13 isoform X2 n=1 Tax=Setaria italica TaxID=4555 RepID=UPI0006455C89|nr:disease resistance protein RPP13 isoform X2 [Setaria italica]
MDLVSGAVGSVIGKLGELLQAEYNLQKGLHEQIKFLKDELESAQTALSKVGEVPPEQLDPQVKLWASKVREASYDMEDILDTFLVSIVDVDTPAEKKDGLLKRLLKNIANLFNKSKERHTMAGAIEAMKKRLQEVADRRDRFSVAVSQPVLPTKPDPRLADMHKEAAQLIGIEETKGDLIAMLLPTPHGNGDSDVSGSNNKMKIVSVVGVGGLGKTTLAKAVYDELCDSPRYDCRAFLSVGRKPDLAQVLKEIFLLLDKKEYEAIRDVKNESLLISELRTFLQNKRYFIVIDDVWDIPTWKTIKTALVENESGSRVITTTRNQDVASMEEVYELRTLSPDHSEKLFKTRLFGVNGEYPANHPAEAYEKILKKCGGIPLAIITMASLLVGKSREDWFAVCNSPGFYRGQGNQQVDDTEWILSLSYYDLPSYLRTCLLYLSVYPEDYDIEKDSLIWKWIAEGFVEKKRGTSLFQQGEEYFNQLINRSMIQAVESEANGIVYACYVHDMVLDLICALSYEENFVTISSNDDEGTSPHQNRVRRLALQNRIMKQTQQDDHMDIAQVRSLVAYSSDIQSWVLHPSFKLLRVLDVAQYKMPEPGWQGLKHLGNLLHLRYLGLRYVQGGESGINQLPEEIGKLKFLQTLHLHGSYVKVLPSAICQLTQLVCLRGDFSTCVPDGSILRKVTSLEYLCIRIDNLDEESQRQFMKDVGNQSELRVLNISVGHLKGIVQSDLVHSLGNLHKLQHLELRDYKGEAAMREWDRAVFPGHLQHLELTSVPFRQLSSGISPMHLPILHYLCLRVDHMDERGLRALGALPELRFLILSTRRPSMACMATVANINTVVDGFFKKLRCCKLYGWMVQLVLNEYSTGVSFSIWNGMGATAFGTKTKDECSRSIAQQPVMPNLQELWFDVPVRALYKDGNGSCGDLGLECLPSFCSVKIAVDCEGASIDDVEKVEAELRNTSQLHPNGPRIILKRRKDDYLLAMKLLSRSQDATTPRHLAVESVQCKSVLPLLHAHVKLGLLGGRSCSVGGVNFRTLEW